MAPLANTENPVKLRRTIGLLGVTLYGLGLTIGAGIYVLVGEAVVRAGPFAPAAFLLSAIVVAFTAGSFAELSSRVPRAAGEAVYVERAFSFPALTILVGLAILMEATTAAAAITVGASGYLAELIALPQPVLIAGVVLSMAAVAGWGIRESIAIAGFMTVIEVAGLLFIIASGITQDPTALSEMPSALMPPLEGVYSISGVSAAALIAFFAYIGFDDIVNLVEEAKNPKRTLPWAIGITLTLVTVIYVLVAHFAARSVTVAEFESSGAPISLLFERLTGLHPLAITLIAVLATINGVVIILIMASRVAYGMARDGRLPAFLGRVSPRTQTPLIATWLVAAVVLGLALFTPLDSLAETSSSVLLAVFALVNLALIRLKTRATEPKPDGFTVPLIIPILGVLTSLALLATGFFAPG